MTKTDRGEIDKLIEKLDQLENKLEGHSLLWERLDTIQEEIDKQHERIGRLQAKLDAHQRFEH